MGVIVVVRHAETLWSRAGRYTGARDVTLTSTGANQAMAVGRALAPHTFLTVFTSPYDRARSTAALAGWHDTCPDADLAAWDYGGYEGLTTEEIRHRAYPGWLLWTDGVIPGATPGETVEQVGRRADRMIARARPILEHGDVAMVSHGPVLCVLAARWLGLPPSHGQHLALSAGSYGVLSCEHGSPVLTRWNTPASR